MIWLLSVTPNTDLLITAVEIGQLQVISIDIVISIDTTSSQGTGCNRVSW